MTKYSGEWIIHPPRKPEKHKDPDQFWFETLPALIMGLGIYTAIALVLCLPIGLVWAIWRSISN